MTNVPAHLKDAKALLTDSGFTIGDTWYHGTSSALVDSIVTNGLKRSGDKALKQTAKQTMATIGNQYTESIEPVFLTQSKELAHYWAEQTVRERSVRFEGDESAVVVEVNLPKEMLSQVKPDVGAASILLLKGDNFMAHMAKIYQDCGFSGPDIDLMNADRMAYLMVLGMAYIDKDIDSAYIEVIA